MLTAFNFEDEANTGDVMAMEDNNLDTRLHAPIWRRVWVVHVDDNINLFDEFGSPIDEPTFGVKEGVQSVDAFIEDWELGYYRHPLQGGTVQDDLRPGAPPCKTKAPPCNTNAASRAARCSRAARSRWGGR